MATHIRITGTMLYRLEFLDLFTLATSLGTGAHLGQFLKFFPIPCVCERTTFFQRKNIW
ncbi:hypothetical protein Hanom_Chr14g01301971 [Helianthus anomalus]